MRRATVYICNGLFECHLRVFFHDDSLCCISLLYEFASTLLLSRSSWVKGITRWSLSRSFSCEWYTPARARGFWGEKRRQCCVELHSLKSINLHRERGARLLYINPRTNGGEFLTVYLPHIHTHKAIATWELLVCMRERARAPFLLPQFPNFGKLTKLIRIYELRLRLRHAMVYINMFYSLYALYIYQRRCIHHR